MGSNALLVEGTKKKPTPDRLFLNASHRRWEVLLKALLGPCLKI